MGFSFQREKLDCQICIHGSDDRCIFLRCSTWPVMANYACTFNRKVELAKNRKWILATEPNFYQRKMSRKNLSKI